MVLIFILFGKHLGPNTASGEGSGPMRLGAPWIASASGSGPKRQEISPAQQIKACLMILC